MNVYTVLVRDLTSPTDVWVHATYDNFEAAEECVKYMNTLREYGILVSVFARYRTFDVLIGELKNEHLLS